MINKLLINPAEYEIKLVYSKGKNVEQLAKEHNADIAINYSYVDYANTGTIYGHTVIDGKKVFSDFEKVKNRSGFGIKDGIPYIGQYKEGSSSYSKAGPLLVSNGKDVRETQIKLEQIPSDIAYSNTDRIGIGLKNGLITILYSDKATLSEMTNKALEEGLDVFNNGDGGGSVTVYHNGVRFGHLRPVCHAWVFIRKNKPLLIIDPGHGGKDNGGGSNEFWKEKDKSLLISLYQYNRFKELGVNITLTRDRDIYLSPTDRATIVKNSGATYCISNHINAAIPEARGVETIHSIYSNGKLAKDIYNAIIEEGMIGRRVFTRTLTDTKKDYYYMHRETGKVETVIVEYGFATNKEDTQLLLHYDLEYAEAVVKAFCEHIGYKYSPPVIKPKNELQTIINELESVINKLKAL